MAYEKDKAATSSRRRLKLFTSGYDNVNYQQSSTHAAGGLNAVKKLTEAWGSHENPFEEEIRNLVNVFDRSVATEEVGECIFDLENLGREQYAKYVDKVIVSKSGSIWDTLHNNKLILFLHESNLSTNTTKTITAI